MLIGYTTQAPVGQSTPGYWISRPATSTRGALFLEFSRDATDFVYEFRDAVLFVPSTNTNDLRAVHTRLVIVSASQGSRDMSRSLPL